VNSLSELELKYIATAQDLKLIDGYPDGTLSPNGLATRAEATVLLFRLLANLQSGGKP
jgi:hypothetical protein